jgi:hypothetical protein
MNLFNFKNNIYKKILCFLSLSFLYFPPSYAELKIEFEDSDSMVKTIFKEAYNTMGKRVGAKKVNWSWCEGGSSYDPLRHFICLGDELKNQDLALAFTTAHEYAHHIQKSIYGYLDRERMNILKIELQADCYAGVILASIPNFYITPEDANKLLEIVYENYGDDDYDHWDHHGSGHNRTLSLRSGLTFGSSKGAIKDNYYKVFCAGDVLK